MALGCLTRSSPPATLLALLLAGAGVSARSQDTVLVAKVEVVQVDVVVTDPHGELVRDLARGDFELLEDGRPQRVTHFLVAGRSSAAPAVPSPAPEAAAPEERATPAERASGPGRHVVLVVDDLHIAPGNLEYAKQALRRLVGEFAEADDNIALVTTGSPRVILQPTRDRAVIRQAIGRLRVREAIVAPARGSQMTPAQAELILGGDRSALQLAARTLIAEPGSMLDTTSPQAAVEAPAGAVPTAPGVDAEAKERVAAREAERQARAILAEALRFSAATLGVIDDVLRSLSPLPGRKLCLLVSDGFLVGTRTSEERTRDLQRIVDTATRSGAVVYALDSHGLVSTGGDASVGGTGVSPGLQAQVERRTEQLLRETLKAVADDTGGFLVRGTNDLAAGLRRMLEDNETYYLMAYEPSNTKRDGRFRRIQVRLPRHPGFTLRTRKGYFAPDDRRRARKPDQPAGAGPLASVIAPGPLDDAEARAVLNAPIPANGIPVRLTTDYLDLPPAGPQAVVRAHVDLAGLRWQEVQGRQQAALELVGGVYDAGGNPVGSPFGRRAELDLTPAEYKRATKTGLQYQQLVPLGPGRFQVRLVARELKLAQLGGAAQWVEIPDLGEKTLAMSGVFLSSSAPTTAGAPADGAVGTETVRDVHTLRRFKRSESLYFQLYVYNPLVDEKGASDVVLQAQIWSAGKVIAASKPQPATLRQKDGVPLPETNGMSLEGLTPGSYELRVVVVDRKANATTFRRVDFSVE